MLDPVCGKQALGWLNVRGRRAISLGDRTGSLLIPQYGTLRLGQELIRLASSIERLANETAEVETEVSAEMVAIRTVVMQNRMALDMLLSEKGGTCAIIGSECCTYIPDNSERITDLTKKIKNEGAKLHNYFKDTWGITSWLVSTFGGWGASILKFICPILFVILIVLCLIKCIPALVTKCFTAKFCATTSHKPRSRNETFREMCMIDLY